MFNSQTQNFKVCTCNQEFKNICCKIIKKIPYRHITYVVLEINYLKVSSSAISHPSK